MLISIDYDDTFTRDPHAWCNAMYSMKKSGHRIIGCTIRTGRESGVLDARYMDLCEMVYFTGGEQKRKFLSDRNIFPHVWIDDLPEFIGTTQNIL